MHVVIPINMCPLCHFASEAEIKKNADLAALAEEFRVIASEIMDMLDGKIPVVSRLKVSVLLAIHLSKVIQVATLYNW